MANELHNTGPNLLNNGINDNVSGACHTLSNGGVLVVYRSSATQIALAYSLDRVSYSSMGVYSPASWDSKCRWSACIDSSNNLHFLWFDTTPALKYVKFTASGFSSWTAGSTESVGTVSNTGGTWMYSQPVVECMDSGAVLTAFTESQTSVPANAPQTRFKLRLTGGTWGAQFSEIGLLPASTPTVAWVTTPSIARDIAGAVSNEQNFAYLVYGAASGKIKLGVKRVNIFTGAVVSTTAIDSNAFGGSITFYAVAGRLFSSAAGEWVGMGQTITTGSVWYSWAFKMSATAYTASPTSLLRPPYASSGVTGLEAVYTQDRGALLWALNGTDVWAHIACFTGTAVIWLQIVWEFNPTGGAGITLIQSGNNRNFSFKHAEAVYLTGVNPTSEVWHQSSKQHAQNATHVFPLPGAVVNTDTPTFRAKPYAAPNTDMPYKAQWAIDTVTFPSPVTVTQPDSAYANPSSTATEATQAIPGGILSQTGADWWAGVMAVDAWGNTGPTTSSAYGNLTYFTVQHPPTMGGLTPNSGAVRAWGLSGAIAVSWTFGSTSPGDSQSAYELIVERNDTGAQIVATGTVVSTASTGFVTIPGANKNMLLNLLGRVRDTSGTWGPFSNRVTFYANEDPTVTITAPLAGTFSNPSPAITFTTTTPSGLPLSTYRVLFYLDTPTWFVESPIYNSGVRSISSPMPTDHVLANASTYLMLVTVTDSAGLSASAVEDDIVMAYTPPAGPGSWNVSNSLYFTRGYTQSTWTNANKDADFFSWRLYRRLTGDTTWDLIHETLEDNATYTYNDYFALPGKSYQYNLVQVAEDFGSLVESVASIDSDAASLIHEDYWLLHQTDSTKHIRLWSVTADPHVDETEQTEMLLIGRGRKFDFGTHWGIRGTLTGQIRGYFDPETSTPVDARTQALELYALADEHTAVWLRNPFGDLWLVSLADMPVEPIAGVGNLQYVDVTMPYAEVSE